MGAMSSDPVVHDLEVVIGLEIHVQLQTKTKLFCGCAPRFGDPPNLHTCPVCLGLPGALPVLNRRAVDLAIRTAVALDCDINPRSCFARKNYFYPDLPKGYQISQFDQPLAEHGCLEFEFDGGQRTASIVRLHLEEDAGKLIHPEDGDRGSLSLIDLNRCGVPLAEIVTAPDLSSAEEAQSFLITLRNTLLYLGVTDANMDEGSLRCDANVSVRPVGQQQLNPKTELKNLNSFRHLRRALRFEVRRQTERLQAGEELRQTTRLWDERLSRSLPMRSKEEAHDYRYFPEPDLVPIGISEEQLQRAIGEVPELPVARARRFVEALGLPPEDAAVLVERPARADYFEALIAAGASVKAASNWFRGQVLRVLNERSWELDQLPVSPPRLAELIDSVDSGKISANMARAVFEQMVQTGKTAAALIAAGDLEQITDDERLGQVVAEVLAARPQEVSAYRAGRTQVLGFLMGEIMRATEGTANPSRAREILHASLNA